VAAQRGKIPVQHREGQALFSLELLFSRQEIHTVRRCFLDAAHQCRFFARWKMVAYTQTDSESPSGSIFVQPFPSTGEKYQVSKLGHHALWSPDGNELFYVPSVTQFLAVSVRFDPSFSFSNPTAVPRGFSEASTMIVRNHDITPDGKFIGKLGASSRSAIANVPIQVVINWFEDLRQRIPAH